MEVREAAARPVVWWAVRGLVVEGGFDVVEAVVGVGVVPLEEGLGRDVVVVAEVDWFCVEVG